MSINLGLEYLVDKPVVEVTENGVFYEYLDVVFEYIDACEELTIVFDRGETLFRAAANLKAVAEYIAQEGITPALEALVGENFENGLTEASVEAAKEGVWAKIKEWFIQLWNAIKQFFLKMFNNAEKLRNRLKAWVDAAATASAVDFSGHEFTGLPSKAFTRDARSILRNISMGNADAVKESHVTEFADSVKPETINFSSIDNASDYAERLITAIGSMLKIKSDMLQCVDENIADAQKIESEEDKNKQVALHKSVKKLINSYFKQISSSAAAFLAHNTLSGKGEGEKEESDSSKKQLPESPKQTESNSDDK